jgi:mono/diheme cytochrome c family protein
MSLQDWDITGTVRHFFAGLVVTASLLLIISGAQITTAQEAGKAGANATAVARGKYIVQGVAACGDCHTPRQSNGELDYSRWLAGAPVPYLSAQPQPDWPIIAPRLAGLPPTNDAGIVNLLTTGIWVTGKPLRSPMPHFRMTRSDAEAVLAYLKSLTPGTNSAQ